jgi:tartrate-resistant acid phosphatase type 5
LIDTSDNFYKNSKGLDGVRSTHDIRWDEIWANVYLRGSMRRIPWYAVLGNHDYVGSIDAQVEKTGEEEMWNMPERQYVQVRALANGARMAMIFIDTNFLHHGYMQKGSDFYTMAMYFRS